ncbi:MAG: PAS domain-containing sensor histidine kinase, partial [Coprothermobacterota bacterium]|nr:PAS domain-containing sensor histidine kinase [Coprothermobacterota bacterium]
LDLFCIADTDGFFHKLNSQWTATLGYPPAELEGRSLLELVHPDDREATEGAIAQLRARLEGPVFVNRYLCRNGSVRWLEWHSRLSGERIFATARDITERKQLEERIRQVRSDLLFAVSHDLKSPLQTLRQTQEMLNELAPGEGLARFQEYGAIWQRNLQRLERIINNLVDSQRGKEDRFPLLLAPCNPVELVKRVVEDLTGYALTLQVTFDLNLQPAPEGACDAEALARVVENLLTNAIKFSPKGGRVEVRLEMEGDTLRLEVEDHGIGIPALEQEQLFQPFQRGPSAQHKGIPGTGLGLYVSRRIVEEHGGALAMESEEGKGTKVTVRLPWGRIGG